ncbi:MAG TPA: hypothetical protein VJR92_15320 [Gemmatimonadaceae bacterium]|nr:hypothetical protein [Gemmatimonadaceae bacterium]
MIAPLYRSATLTALALAVFSASCGDDESLGAPDAKSCTRGSLSVDRTVEGKVDAESCVLWDDYNYDLYPAESWTFQTSANKAYIVRLVPIEDDEAVNNFNGEMEVYARNDEGDAYYATGYWDTYGVANGNGGVSQELVFTSRKSERVSIRVNAYSAADTGAYELTVISCPMPHIAAGATSAAVEFNADCALESEGVTPPTPVAFFNFDANIDDDIDVTATRTAGTSTMRFRVRGPDLDFGCYTASCTSISSATGVGPLTLSPNFDRSGNFTVAVYQATVGTLTATVGVVLNPPPAAPARGASR